MTKELWNINFSYVWKVRIVSIVLLSLLFSFLQEKKQKAISQGFISAPTEGTIYQEGKTCQQACEAAAHMASSQEAERGKLALR